MNRSVHLVSGCCGFIGFNVFSFLKTKKYSIAGPLLYSSDVIATNIILNEQEIGDFINISDVGAYFNSQSSHFLFARCATVLEDVKGNFSTIERKEEFEDIIKRSS